MDIISALLKEEGVRVSHGNRWIVFDKDSDEWKIYERARHAKKTRLLGASPFQSTVVEILLED